MFAGHAFVAADDVSREVRSLVWRFGGVVVDSLEPFVTDALITAHGRAESVAGARRIRGLRIPIVRDTWVLSSVAAGRLVPKQHPHTAYDPNMFHALCFTTTMLPAAVKANAVAVIIFYGGRYSPNLTASTNVALRGAAKEECVWSCKRRVAAARGIPCVSMDWLQNCVSAGRLLPLPAANTQETTTTTIITPTAAAAGAKRRRSLSSSQEYAAAAAAVTVASDGGGGSDYKQTRLERLMDRIILGHSLKSAQIVSPVCIAQIADEYDMNERNA